MALDYDIIGKRIKKARIKKGLSQEELAEKMDVSVAFLSRVERGGSHANLRRLNEMCNILDVSLSSILEGTSEEFGNYLNKDFTALLKNCPPEKLKIIYNVAKVIIEGE